MYFVDTFIRYPGFVSKDVIKITPTKLFTEYKRYCSENNIHTSGNASGFGLIFKDKTRFEKEDIGIENKKTNGIRSYVMDKHKVFEWLQSNDYTMYDELPTCAISTDSEDELEP